MRLEIVLSKYEYLYIKRNIVGSQVFYLSDKLRLLATIYLTDYVEYINRRYCIIMLSIIKFVTYSQKKNLL